MRYNRYNRESTNNRVTRIVREKSNSKNLAGAKMADRDEEVEHRISWNVSVSLE